VNVCVVGSGGREHALARALARSADVVVTPGNPGMAAEGLPGRIEISARPAEEIPADLVVIGPEVPLVDGLADRLRSMGRSVVGPGADGAQLEGSKALMKQLLAEAGVPTASFGVFDQIEPALRYLRSLPGPPWVVKTDGLAAGKGVLVAGSLSEAEADVVAKLSGEAFGDAGRRVVVEEGLAGPECSLLALCDGRRAVPLSPARDFKRLGTHGTGPNTGGMGSYSPIEDLSPAMVGELMDTAVEPLLAALGHRGIEYRGVLYAGLMLTEAGPKVLEYNVRLGDPETQVVLPRLAGDVAGLLKAVADGALGTADAPCFVDDAAVCVVLAAAGYPGTVRSGDPIGGLGADGQLAVPREGVTVFHAGTARAGDGPFVTAGGRVLGVTAVAPTVDAARRRAYEAAEAIHWPGMLMRRDVAEQAAMAEGGLRS
jgi:phosphoribosylamine--glycine ligase